MTNQVTEVWNNQLKLGIQGWTLRCSKAEFILNHPWRRRSCLLRFQSSSMIYSLSISLYQDAGV